MALAKVREGESFSLGAGMFETWTFGFFQMARWECYEIGVLWTR